MSIRILKLPRYEVKVRRSRIGLGLFAQEPIPKDELIIEYVGLLLSNEMADRIGGKFLFEIDEETVIDGSARSNLARYINHSCRPNCETEVEGKRVFVYAKKNIKAGRELTINYGQQYFNDFITEEGCQCAYHLSKRGQ